MHQIQSLVNCIDNSGAAIVECVNVLRSKRPAKVGMCHPKTETKTGVNRG